MADRRCHSLLSNSFHRAELPVRRIWALAWVVLSSASLVQSQTPNPDPRGLYVYSWDIALENSPSASSSLSHGGTVDLMNALRVPGIDGITIVAGWNELEPELGVHQWDQANRQPWSSSQTYLIGDEVTVGSTFYIAQKNGLQGTSHRPGQSCSDSYAPDCDWHQTGGATANLLDEWIVAAIQAGKKITLAVRAAQNTPCWLFESGKYGCAGAYSNYANLTPYPFEVAAHQGGGVGGCISVTLAAPWEHAFLSSWDELLDSLSTHLKQTPSPNPGYSLYDFVNIVRVSGINRSTDETRLPAEILDQPCTTNAVDTWLTAGYRPSLLLTAWNSLMQSVQAWFGDKYVNVALISTDGGPQSTNRNGQFPFPMIDDNGCVYWKFIPNTFPITWTSPPCRDLATSVPDQNFPLMTLASQIFPGHLVAEVENLDFEFTNDTPQAAPAHPNVVSYAQTLGTMAAFQTNDYLAPFPQRNGGASCWPFATVASLEGKGEITNSGGGRCFAQNSFVSTSVVPVPSWYGQILQAGIAPATTANSAWKTTADPNLKSQALEIFLPDILGTECTQKPPLTLPATKSRYLALATKGPPAGCGYPVEIAQAHSALIDPPIVTIAFPAAPASHWYNTLPLAGSASATSVIGESISHLKCTGAVTVHGTASVALDVNTQGGPAVVTCTATDRIGNTGEAIRALWIDTQPPVTTASYFGEPDFAIVTFTATDNLSGVAVTQYSVNGGSWVDGTGASFTSAGTYNIGYRSIDVAGNVENSQFITIRVAARRDGALPTILRRAPEASR